MMLGFFLFIKEQAVFESTSVPALSPKIFRKSRRDQAKFFITYLQTYSIIINRTLDRLSSRILLDSFR